MFYIGEGIELNYLEADGKLNLEEFINKKKFTVKDTPLTYRQINSLDEGNLLKEDRHNKKGWRKFSFKELTFILLVDKLKKFGLQHHQLKELFEYFLEEKYTYLSDLAIGCVLGQIEITINIDNEGKVDIFDPNFYILIGTPRPHIKITLNDIVNEIAIKAGKHPFPVKYSIEKALNDKQLLPKEEELIRIIRNKSYSSITVKKKDGGLSLVYAQKTKQADGLSDKGVIEMLRSGDFQNISIIKRDGKIVSHTIEETIKL